MKWCTDLECSLSVIDCFDCPKRIIIIIIITAAVLCIEDKVENDKRKKRIEKKLEKGEEEGVKLSCS